VPGHFHLIMGVASIFGIFAATYYWFPKMFGRMMSESLARWHFFISLIGTYAIFNAHALSRHGGNAAAVLADDRSQLPSGLDSAPEVHHLCGVCHHRRPVDLPLQSLLEHVQGEKASDNPWEATTLEWITATPPPHDNFGAHTPVVHNGPYEYSVPGAPRDYVMQTDPEIEPTH